MALRLEMPTPVLLGSDVFFVDYGEKVLLRSTDLCPKIQASCDESQDARQPSPRTALPPRESLESDWPFVHVTLVTLPEP